MLRNDCCTDNELIAVCVGDENGNVGQYYRCPLCGRTYKEKTMTLYLSKKNNKKKLIDKFLKNHPEALIVRKNVFVKKYSSDNVITCLGLGYI